MLQRKVEAALSSSSSHVVSGTPTQHWYSPGEPEAAARMVGQLRAELGTDVGAACRVARQLGYGEQSLRNWVKQADIDGFSYLRWG